MLNSEALKIIENTLSSAGISILRIGSINPAKFNNYEHPEVSEGRYRVLDITLAVREND